jgi:hypothetical protein
MERAIDATFDIFESAAFLRFEPSRGKYLPRFNVAIFDTLTWYFADFVVAEAAVTRTAAVRHAFEELCRTDQDFSSYLTSTTKTTSAAIGRLTKWGDALGAAIGVSLDYRNYVLPVLPIAPRPR